MADTNQVVKAVVPAVAISEEMAAKLYRAFLGLPDQRNEKVREAAKAKGISVQQATFEDILYHQIEKYEAKAAEKEAEILTKALQTLVDLGKAKSLENAKELLAQLAGK